jgi:putative ABC transport system substrate-binding protein
LARAQVPAAPRRIGYLSGFNRVASDFLLRELRPKLEKLGWTEGRNFGFLEPRMADGANERLPILAAELVAERPDLILVQTIPATRDLVKATKSIPIVMVAVATPVELGIVADYRRPGGNVTGSSYFADELMRKALQLLKEAAPRLHSIAVFSNPTNEAALPMSKQMRRDASALGMQAQIVEVRGKGDIESALEDIHTASTEAILLPPEPLIQSNRESIAAFAEKRGLPLAVVGTRGVLPATGLFAYGTNFEEYALVTAKYVDRIFRGAKPGDLPIEQPTRFTLVITLKAARKLGLTIPQSMLLAADELIQ